MSLDFNDGERQRSIEIIPQGTVVRVVGTIKPGGISRPGSEQADAGWLTASRSSDVLMLKWEFVVTDGPYRNRRFWPNMTVHGGDVNEKGESKGWNVAKSQIRAMLNSARNIKPDDESPTALAARRINSWADLNGIECLIKVGVEKGQNGYPDKNRIGTIIEPGNKEYVPPGTPMPASAAVVSAPAAAPATPAWGAPPPVAAPAASSSTPAWAR